MLEYLRIRNLALIEDMELEFSEGLNALTGETGAGKSFILKALGFLTGDRLGADLVRPGAEKAEAEALFVLADGSECVVRRELAGESGRSRLFVNDKLTSQESIRELRPALLIHASQHGQQQLLQPAFQARVLDEFMARPDLLAERDANWQALRELVQRRDDLRNKIATLSDRREALEFQQAEIDKVSPEPGEEERLEEERAAIKQSADSAKGIEDALLALHGDGCGGILEHFSRLERSVSALGALDPDFADDAEALEEMRLSLTDLDGRLRRAGRDGPGEEGLETIERRLFELSQLKRKLRRAMPEILSLRDEIAGNLSFLDSAQLDLARLDKEERALCDALAASLDSVNAAREQAGVGICTELEAELRQLGFSEHVSVEFAFQPYSLYPADPRCVELRPRLMWRPNPGQAAQPLDRIASGGELSRFLLAVISLKSARSEDAPLLIFDEVDAGVGGLTLGRVADRLADLALRSQILLITHWPQLAVRAKRHFQVRKEVRDGATFTLCSRLTGPEVRGELVRMAGGGSQGEALARQLLGTTAAQ